MPRIYLFAPLLALGAFLQVSPARLQTWSLIDSHLQATPLPAQMTPLSSPAQGDFQGNGEREALRVLNGHASLLSGRSIVWQSPADWQVSQAWIADLTHSGHPQAVLLVWRPFRPWPVDQWLPHGGRIDRFHNSSGESCQLILIGWRLGRYTEIWAGSALADPVMSFAAADLAGTGRQELVTLEGNYADPPDTPAHDLKVWEWNGFGFSVVDSIQGTFTKVVLARDESDHIVLLGP
jgi:hypothetical protein